MASSPGLLLVVVHVSKTDAQRHRPPLCSQQFSLANYACANLPFMPLSTMSSPLQALLTPLSSSTTSTPATPPPPPTTPTTTPPPPALSGRRGGGHHQRGRGHHRHAGSGSGSASVGVGVGVGDGDDADDDDDDAPPASPAEENCCRWLKEMDSECVCDVLVRLPPFLAKPSHVYSVHVYDGCVVTFSCSGRIVP